MSTTDYLNDELLLHNVVLIDSKILVEKTDNMHRNTSKIYRTVGTKFS